jgi:signal transduction histidine kinase
MPDMGEERRRQYLDQIADSAQALAGIIADILDLSKIEAGKLQVERVPFDLGELLQTLQQTYQALAGAHGLTLHFDVGPDVAGLVIGDPLRAAPDREQLSQQRTQVHATGPCACAGTARQRRGWRPCAF